MTKTKEFRPKGYHTVTHVLVVDNATKALEFYTQGLGAKVRVQTPGPSESVLHAEIEIGDSVIFLSDEFPMSDLHAPKKLGGSTAGVWLYVPDADATFKKAVAAGAKVTQELQDMFWGDRSGSILDPFGHAWSIATHVEDVPPEEMEKRREAAMRDFPPPSP
jgi:PhnB protein